MGGVNKSHGTERDRDTHPDGFSEGGVEVMTTVFLARGACFVLFYLLLRGLDIPSGDVFLQV